MTASRNAAEWLDCAIATFDDEPYLDGSGVTATGVDIFTQGEYWYLAWVLHKMTGWPPVTLSYGLPTVDWFDHVLVRTPEGLLLDVNGAVSQARMLARWGKGDVSASSLDLATEIPGFDTKRFRAWLIEFQSDPVRMPALMRRRTEEVARHLLAQIEDASLALAG